MERKIEDKSKGEATLLIDFSSPVSKRSLHTPLIPVPIVAVANQASLSPTNTTPFDVVVKQTISLDIISNDPFECASKSALSLVNSQKPQNQDSETQENSLPHVIKSIPVSDESEDVNMQRGPLIEINDAKVLERNDLLEISAIENKEPLFENKAILPVRQIDEASQVSGDFSTEEDIKTVIAKRINKCIQKVLSNSAIKSKSDKPKDNHNHGKKSVNRKSASFTTNVAGDKVCDRLNKSCTVPSSTDDSFTLLNQNLKSPEISIGSCDVTPLSFLSGELSKNDDSAFLTTENDEVFQEANKLARTFSKISESFSKNKEEANCDDLLTCKPQWLYADSSEDEEDKLRKDPALNIRVSLSNSITQDQPDSKALSEFKSRNRRSLTNLQDSNTQSEKTLKRSLSIGSKPLIAPVLPVAVLTVPVILEKQEANPLRLKKYPSVESRKGPMRAVMPVQSMARESLTTGVQPVRKYDKSPVRKKNTSQIMMSPVKDTSQLNIHPVASSTPNKCSTPVPKMMIPIVVPNNKRHSLGSTTESRKSRTSVAETGPRQRSSSASSSIPTPMDLQCRALGPRSTSNLLRNPLKAKINAHPEKESPKSRTKETKPNFNPKALNEVKPIIGRPNRVKSAVNAISNVVTGKNKKLALRDKENRFPA